MRKPSKGCNKRDGNYHRNDHTDGHGKRFFKVLIGDFHKRLVIPSKFAKHFGDKIERSITLESPFGCTFEVQVAKNLGRVMLQSGWKSFVSAHDLKKTDFLVFKYDGMSRMKVLIFDPSGWEKVPPCFVAKNAISGGRKREETIDISSGCANLPMKTPETKKTSWKQRDRSRISISSSKSLSNSSEGMPSSEDDEAHSVPSYMLPQRTILDSMEKKRVKEKLRAICSEIPIYVCVMNKSNISRKSRTMVVYLPRLLEEIYKLSSMENLKYWILSPFFLLHKSESILWAKGGGFKSTDGLLHSLTSLTNESANRGIPTIRAKDFSRKYSDLCFPFKRSRVLILQCHGKTWEVMCHVRVRKDRQTKSKSLLSGWARFAGDNNLQLGDICLFEPLKTKTYTMNVHIIRKE